MQGTTGRGSGEELFDLGVYGAVPTGELMQRWRRLLDATGMKTAVHARQIHGARIVEWYDPLPPGVLHLDGYDGHLSDQPGLMLSVSIADCVPVSLVEERSRTVALVHAGWRGVAASIVERSIERVAARTAADPALLWLHCGPSICGVCYEVGLEVHEGVNPDSEPPRSASPIDLRAAIARRAAAVGMDPARITVSTHCTRCGPGDFFSHRAGSAGRQMGVLGRAS
ncbi:MAG: laccase domain-containing protein [Gemmatimonadota bacterium]